MRPLIAAVALAMVVATGACSFPTQQFRQSDARPPADAPPDAPPGPFDCHNVLPPTTAPESVTISGVVQVALTAQGLGGAVVELFTSGSRAQMVTTLATADPQHPKEHPVGWFSFSQATANRPVDVYLRITHNDNNYLPILYYPAESVTKDITINPQMFDAVIAGTVGMGMGVTFDLVNKVQFLIGAVDCQEVPLGNVTVTVSPEPVGEKVHYFIDNPGPTPDKDATITDSGTGVAIASNLLPEVITISATVPSPIDGSTLTMFRHSIDAGGDKGMLIQTEIRP